MNILDLNKMFIKRKGIFGQIYKSARLEDKEITVDNLIEDYRVCLCTPYNERLEKKGHFKGAGEVIKEWHFYSFTDSLSFLLKENVI